MIPAGQILRKVYIIFTYRARIGVVLREIIVLSATQDKMFKILPLINIHLSFPFLPAIYSRGIDL